MIEFHRFAVASLVLTNFVVASPVNANPICNWFHYCVYESPGFKIKVVDKETGKPLADVHALAEWIQYGMYGHHALLMVQEALSGADGILVFPPWGPTQGSSAGLMFHEDPVITLYKRGYDVMIIQNEFTQTDERARVRGFAKNGHNFALRLFQGNSDDRIKQLDNGFVRLAIPGNEEMRAKFRDPYLNRLRRLLVEKDTVSQEHQDPGKFFWQVQKAIRYLDEGKR